MWEKLYDLFNILVCLEVNVYVILLVTLTSFKMNKIENEKILSNVTFLAMLNTMILIIVNFIFELMLEKSKVYDIFFILHHVS